MTPPPSPPGGAINLNTVTFEQLRQETGLPVSTMTEAVVDGLRSVGAKRIAVATAYADEVNNRLADFLRKSGFEVLSLKGFGLFGFAGSAETTPERIVTVEWGYRHVRKMAGQSCPDQSRAARILRKRFANVASFITPDTSPHARRNRGT